MRPAELILSPCGTSLLTWRLGAAERERLTRLTNLREGDLSPEERGFLDELALRAGAALEEGSGEAAAARSAELSALSRHCGGDLRRPDHGAQDLHLLVQSDTYAGQLAVECLRSFLESRRWQVQVLQVPDLAARDLEGFRQALGRLTRQVLDYTRPHREAGGRVVFNLTGGFKGVQGFLQALAMVAADETFYLFEQAPELLRIPRLPLQLDVEGILAAHLDAFRRMEVLGQVPAGLCAGLPETLYDRYGEECALSPWGVAVWEQGWRDLYRARLLPPLTERVVLGPRFEREARALQPDRLERLNVSLDLLARHLVRPDRPNPRSLHVHALQGDPQPGCTHEFYAWSDLDAARCYGRLEGGTFFVDRLDKHA